MSPQPLIKNGISECVEQDKDGVVGGEVSLSSCPVQEQMGQVVEAPHHGVISPLGGAVACPWNSNSNYKKKQCDRET